MLTAILNLIWPLLPIPGLFRAIYLRRRFTRVLNAATQLTEPDVIHTMRFDRRSAGVRVVIHVIGIGCMIVAPFCERWIPVEIRVPARNAMIEIILVLVSVLGELNIANFRFLDAFNRPGAISEATRAMKR